MDVPSTLVNCPMDGCKWKIRIFGVRERNLATTFYSKPKTVAPEVPPKHRPSAASRNQRAHLETHKRHVVAGTREARRLQQAQARLASKRFRAKGDTAEEKHASRRRRTNALGRDRYREMTRVAHRQAEASWEVREVNETRACLRRCRSPAMWLDRTTPNVGILSHRSCPRKLQLV